MYSKIESTRVYCINDDDKKKTIETDNKNIKLLMLA